MKQRKGDTVWRRIATNVWSLVDQTLSNKGNQVVYVTINGLHFGVDIVNEIRMELCVTVYIEPTEIRKSVMEDKIHSWKRTDKMDDGYIKFWVEREDGNWIQNIPVVGIKRTDWNKYLNIFPTDGQFPIGRPYR